MKTKTQAATEWNDAAMSAYHRIVEGTGKSLTRIAADMGYSETSLRRFVSGDQRWSLDAVLALAVATEQHPGRMIGRESLP